MTSYLSLTVTVHQITSEKMTEDCVLTADIRFELCGGHQKKLLCSMLFHIVARNVLSFRFPFSRNRPAGAIG